MREPKDAEWAVFPTLEAPRYFGMQTNIDPSTVSDTALVSGSNIFFFDGDRFGSRPFGLKLVPGGSASVVSGGYQSMKTFRKRDGTNIMMGAYGTDLQVYDQENKVWANLVSSTGSSDYGFAEFNVNADQKSLC